MIPRYPVFKPLELSDYTEVSTIARRFPPYSDFNFVSLWSWNTSGACQVSTLHGNLVVRLADYVSNVPLYTFLGTSSVTETAAELVRRSNDEGLGTSLRLVPEQVAHLLDRARMTWEMDVDGSDYVLSTARMRSFKGTELQKKRNWVNRFQREHPRHRVEAVDLASRAAASSLLTCFEEWAEQHGAPRAYDLVEYNAFKRLLHAADFFPDLHGMAVYVDDRLAAFMVLELVQQRFGMGHFSKADARYAGLTPFMMREVGEFLASRGYEHFNYQQDLGIEGLRHSKKSYVPAAFLRKYVIAARAAASARPSQLSVPAVSDAFLTGAPAPYDAGLSLRPPSLSEELLRMAREEEDRERERALVRQSRITFARPEPEEATGEHPGAHPDSKVG